MGASLDRSAPAASSGDTRARCTLTQLRAQSSHVERTADGWRAVGRVYGEGFPPSVTCWRELAQGKGDPVLVMEAGDGPP